MKRWPVATLSLVVLATVVQLVPGAAAAVQYERSAVALGEGWRLLTGHLAHWSVDHFFWDVLVLLVLGIACERVVGRGRTVVTVLAASIAISVGLWFAQPMMQAYRGLSGIDSALFGLVLVTVGLQFLQTRRRRSAIVVVTFGLAFGVKLLFEIATQRSVFVDAATSGFVPVPLAHAIGASIGCAVAVARGVRGFAHPRAAATIPAT